MIRFVFIRVHLWLILSVMVGCNSGPPVNQLSGKVTFKGEPVPAGRVFFLPDPRKNNSGPGGFAEIKNGVYDTRSKGAGSPSGPLIVRIDGFDGKVTPGNPNGQILFLSYETTIDLTPGTPTKDIEVPASAAYQARPGGSTEPP